jgi:signal transduction histidine kinase
MAKTVKVPKSIVAPVLVEGEIMGIFSVQADDLRGEDAPAITAFAHQLAVTWRRVDLLRDLEYSLEELKRAQDQLVQAQKMEAIGQLAGGVAHDFNNLLTAINGFAALMQLQLTPDSPLWEMTEKILDGGRRAAALVRQLLAFSRKQIIQPQALNLNLIVADMEMMLRRLIGEDIRLETNLSSGLWPVNQDPTQIGQVIINLAVNARDAMPAGGKLVIETANITLDHRAAAGFQGEDIKPGEYVRLVVSDTGTGMSREVQAHMFEPFFTTKETGKGTGLGLATVYGIVKQSGGVIQVHSEEGQGASFKIYLPHSREVAQPPLPLEVGQKMPVGNETILLVEDDEDVRGLVRRVLQSQGYHLLEARSGQEALRLVAGYRGFIHLLLTDVVMPEVGGKALSEQLTASQPGLKVIYMSGYSGSAISHQGELDPKIPLLQKPFTPKELARKIRAVLDD